MQNSLYLIRGLPGAGKSTFARHVGWTRHAADDFFEELAKEEDKTYAEVFDPKLLGKAHAQCLHRVELDMAYPEHKVAVHNTFTTRKEMKPYFDLAEKYNYRVFVVTVEKHHNNENDHQVPPEAIERMAKRWQHVDERLKR